MPPTTPRAVLLKDRLASDSLVLAVFTASLFVSATLLFAVQPMFAKMVLPRLGGSPAVWSVAMCFFQAALLAGYAYAHVLTRLAPPLTSLVVHLVLMAVALTALPLGIADGWGRPPEAGLHVWVLGLFAASIGLPFFALAGNAPLLQAWFARTGHPHSGDPYFLYGASNLGSLIALLAYPVLIEPALPLQGQAEYWAAGFHLLLLLVGTSGLLMLLRPMAAPAQGTALAARSPGSMRDRLAWTALAFVPSGLLVAVTSHITTDVAAAPFLWVAPLALYLLTFVVTFQRRPVLPHRLMLAVQPALVALLVASLYLPFRGGWPVLLSLHLLAFFVSAMVCHGELVSRRPATDRLTEFYLCMSLGGALGGLFAGLIAPQIFSTVLEYPLLIVLALLARPGQWPSHRAVARAGLMGTVAAAAVLGPIFILGIDPLAASPVLYVAVIAAFAILIAVSRDSTPLLVCIAAAAMICGEGLKSEYARGESHRSFFGVNRVVERSDPPFRTLMHGTTVHGAQRIGPDEAGPPEPLTYYHRDGPFADVIEAVRRTRAPGAVAAIGLGTGSLACYRRAHETWRFFEIDATVVRIARDPALFRFLSECAPDADIVVGDARLTLEDEADGRYDLMIIDAFSSDAIPVHLVTVEAIRLYFAKLRGGGLTAFHVSNRNMDLAPVLAAAADRLGLAGLIHRPGPSDFDFRQTMKTPATVVVLARSAEALEVLGRIAGWGRLPAPALAPWTDDYSNVLAAIRAKFRFAQPSAIDEQIDKP